MFRNILTAVGLVALGLPATAAEDGRRVQIKGELIDTWCYYSGVMGGPDAVVGSAHHTCAMWCAAGGIPVGVLAEDGTVYMVVKWEGASGIADGSATLRLASHTVTADGRVWERDGITYLVVDKVIEDHGITNQNHDDYGVVPGFAIPEKQE